jgi:peptidoglycan/xylan/chitin deacetylase (PgdA/CDA1 family)
MRSLILNYHKIYSVQKGKDSKYCVSADEFKWQMEQLSYSNLKNILPKDLNHSEANSFVLTFDDGYSSDFETVSKILVEFNFKAAFFILSQSDALLQHAENYKELIRNGHQVASHGTNHESLKPKMKNELLDEFERSREQIKYSLGIETEDFSLPYGQFNPNTIISANSRGFKRVYGTQFGFYEGDNFSEVISRWTITDKVTRETFNKVISHDSLTLSRLKIESSLKKVVTQHLNSKHIYQFQKILHSCF